MSLSTSDHRHDPSPGDPVEVARQVVLRQLSHAPRTRAQLQEACRRRGVPDEASEVVLDRFSELGLIDDQAFARAWVESRHAGRGLARRALRHELADRGVHPEVVEQAVAQIDQDAERAGAERLVRARLPALARHDRTTQTRRLHGLLVRRGYPAGMALAVVRSVLEEEYSG